MTTTAAEVAAAHAGRRRPGDRVPLTPAQRRLVFLQRLEPTSPAYNVANEIDVRLDVDVDRLGRAVVEVLSRHDVLRQVITGDDEQAELVELPAEPLVKIVCADWQAATEVLHAAAGKPFDLQHEAPVRWTLVSVLGPGGGGESDQPVRRVLQITAHHAVTDGWTEVLLQRELTAAYDGRPLPAPVQYADVSGPSPFTAEDLAWWVQRLDPLPAAVQVPADRPRPPVADASGGQVSFVVPPAVAERVRQQARAAMTTPAAVLLAAMQALLHRTTGASDLVVGMPEAGRVTREQEHAVGCFINTLPVRATVHATDGVRALVDRASAALFDALDHRSAGFDRVVDAIQPDRDLSTTPVFQVALNVQSTPVEALDAPGGPGLFTSGIRGRWTPAAKCDLSIALTNPAATDRPLEGVLVYRTSLMDRETAEAWARWFLEVLRAVLDGLERPATAVADLPLGADETTLPLLDGGPATPWPGRTLLDAVERHAAEDGGRVAAVGPDGDVDAARLWARSEPVAHRLNALGLAPGTPVGVFVDRCVDLVVGLVACWRAGLAYLPLDPAYPPERVMAALAASGAGAVLTHRSLAPDVGGAGLPVVLLDDPATYEVPEPGGGPLPGPAGPDEVAYVICTSGSTGAPKAVAVTHANLLAYLGAALPRLDVGCDQRTGTATGPDGRPPSFGLVSTHAADLGMTCLMGALATGGTIHLLDRATAGDPDAMAAYLRRHEVDVIKLVPSHLEMLAAHGDLGSVLPRRTVVIGGEPVPWTLVDHVRAARPDLAAHTSYGPTETTVSVTWGEPTAVPDHDRHGVAPLGRPFAGVRLAVLDDAGRPLPRGVVGELAVGGPTVSRGYLGAVGATPAPGTVDRFVPDPHGGSGRWYRTGDAVRVRHDGRLDVLGRRDDQVKVRGHRVELDEVAAACSEVPGVTSAVVLPVGEAHRRRLVAWLAADPAVVTPASVRAVLRDRLPDYMLPSDVVVLADLPLNPNGKVDRHALVVPEPGQGPPSRPPEGPTEERVAAVLATITGVEQIGAEDDFFALGGDSFGAVRAVAAIGSGLAVLDLFRHPTVADLAALLDRRELERIAAAEGAGDGTPGAGGLQVRPVWPLGRPLLQQLSGPGPARPPALTVVCVPYGGGAAIAYQPLASALPDEWDVLAVELPGHDPLDPSEALRPAAQVIDQVVDEVRARTDGDLLVYGHCLGGAVAMALAQRLEQDGQRVVGTVVAGTLPSARLPGRLARAVTKVLPTDRFTSDRRYREVLGLLGGLDDLDGADPADRERNDAMLRALRHDSRQAEVISTAQLAGQADRLRAPVLVVVGERDRTTELYAERYTEWAAFAERVELATIPRAGHYFLKHQADQLAGHVRRHVGRWRRGDAPEPTTPQAVRRQLGGLRTFSLVALVQTLSLIGTNVAGFGLAVHVLIESGSLSQYAIVTMLALIPAILLVPVGGALADRVDRRLLMLGADAAAAVGTIGLAILWWTGGLELWHIYASVSIGSAATAFHRPAWLAAIAQLVPKPYLVQANAVAQLGAGLGTLMAPVAGGALLVLGGLGGVLVVDIATFTLSAVVLLCVRFPNRLHRHRDESFRRSLTGGWRFLLRRPPLVAMTAFFVVANLLLAVPLVLAAPITLAIGSPALLGVVTAAGGAGAVVGSIVMVAWGGTRRRVLGMVGFTAFLGAGSVIMGVRPSATWVAAGLATLWFGLNVLNAHWLALIQRKVGIDLQGRVIAANQMLAMLAMPIGFLVCAPLVGVADGLLETWPEVGDLLGGGAARGEGVVLVVVGVALVVWTVLGLQWRPLRNLETILPDALPPSEVSDDLDELQAQADAALAARTGRRGRGAGVDDGSVADEPEKISAGAR